MIYTIEHKDFCYSTHYTYKVAHKAHEWAEYNYDQDEVRINFIDILSRSESVIYLNPPERMLITYSHAIDYANERNFDLKYQREYDYFLNKYECELDDYFKYDSQKAIQYCKILDACGYFKFSISDQ